MTLRNIELSPYRSVCASVSYYAHYAILQSRVKAVTSTHLSDRLIASIPQMVEKITNLSLGMTIGKILRK